MNTYLFIYFYTLISASIGSQVRPCLYLMFSTSAPKKKKKIVDKTLSKNLPTFPSEYLFIHYIFRDKDFLISYEGARWFHTFTWHVQHYTLVAKESIKRVVE